MLNGVFYLVDLLVLVVQHRIVRMVWSKKKKVQEFEMMTIMVIVYFSPLQLVAPSAQNVGVFKDLLCYLNIYMFLQDGTETTLQPLLHSLVIGFSVYLDPSSLFFNIGVLICTPKKISVFVVFSVIIPVMFYNMFSSSQLQNTLNIMTLRDHSENIGLYWYISIEVFKNHTDFFKHAYVLYNFMMIAQIR
jgi:hypothetical protein